MYLTIAEPQNHQTTNPWNTKAKRKPRKIQNNTTAQPGEIQNYATTKPHKIHKYTKIAQLLTPRNTNQSNNYIPQQNSTKYKTAQ